MRKQLFSILTILFLLISSAGAASAVTYPPSLVHMKGAMAYQHTKYLSEKIGQRVMGTPGKRQQKPISMINLSAWVTSRLNNLSHLREKERTTHLQMFWPIKKANQASKSLSAPTMILLQRAKELTIMHQASV